MHSALALVPHTLVQTLAYFEITCLDSSKQLSHCKLSTDNVIAREYLSIFVKISCSPLSLAVIRVCRAHLISKRNEIFCKSC